MSSRKQDSTKGLVGGKIRSEYLPFRTLSYNAGRSVLECPVAAFLITIDNKSLLHRSAQVDRLFRNVLVVGLLLLDSCPLLREKSRQLELPLNLRRRPVANIETCLHLADFHLHEFF
ncbi:hypothetical protein TNCV_4753441 [Trichonephila clavipes]|nr:hypothetical protein TNCV_4753441 [Trichonephila clavipes]